MSYSELHHQKDFLVLRPVDSVTAVDLKQAADTSLALFYFPKCWKNVQIIKMGGNILTAGGAVTVAGKAKLQIDGTDVENDLGTVLTLDWPGADAVVHSSIEKDMNLATDDFGSRMWADVDDGVAIEMLVHTEGTGAGDQEFHPYLVVRINPM